MSERYKVRNPDGIYFVTLTVVDWIDLFIRPVYKHILVDSIQYCQANKGLVVHAYVFMTSHIHAIFSAKDVFLLQEIMRDMKKHTSLELINAIQEYPESRREWMLERFKHASERIKRSTNYKVWQDACLSKSRRRQGFHPVELVTNKMIEQRLNYIHQNPVEEEIVINAEDYKYSSAIDYAGGVGEIEIDKL